MNDSIKNLSIRRNEILSEIKSTQKLLSKLKYELSLADAGLGKKHFGDDDFDCRPIIISSVDVGAFAKEKQNSQDIIDYAFYATVYDYNIAFLKSKINNLNLDFSVIRSYDIYGDFLVRLHRTKIVIINLKEYKTKRFDIYSDMLKESDFK